MFIRAYPTRLLLFSALAFTPHCPAAWYTFSNTNRITVTDSYTPPTKAVPYPSTNYVSGIPGVVSKVTVRLHGFSHTFPSDVSFLLVGPSGQRAILMSQVGGQSALSVTNLSLTLDDDATGALPVYERLASGTFRPANGYLQLHYPSLPYDFPAPALPGNSNAVSTLAVFKGTDPNGTWNLFIVDDAAGNAGSLWNGWSLSINDATPLQAVRAQNNVVLSWTNTIAGCTLQCAPTLAGTWTNALPLPVLVGGRYTVTNRIQGGSAFYRLIR